MKFTSDIQAAINDPKQMENLYQHSIQSSQEAEFRLDLEDAYEKSAFSQTQACYQLGFSRHFWYHHWLIDVGHLRSHLALSRSGPLYRNPVVPHCGYPCINFPFGNIEKELFIHLVGIRVFDPHQCLHFADLTQSVTLSQS